MPRTKVVFYKEHDGSVPVLEWLDGLPAKAQLKCLAKLQRLKQEGHELRRPEADLLTDRIYELRASLQGIHYRILYFFHGNIAAVVSHGIMKEDRVPRWRLRALQGAGGFSSLTPKHTLLRSHQYEKTQG